MTSTATRAANKTAADQLAAPPEHNVVAVNGGTPTNGHGANAPAAPEQPAAVGANAPAPAPAPEALTVAQLRKALQGVDGSLPVTLPGGPAGTVTVDATGALIGRLAKPRSGNGGSTAGRKVMRLTERGPLLAAFLKDQLGRKASTEVTAQALAAAVDCSVSVLSYSVPSDPAVQAFAAAGITVCASGDLGTYTVTKA